jgi:integrase/recombinase XerD
VARKNPTVVATVSTGLERAVEDFMAFVRAQGGSARTEEYYSAVLGRVFMPWCREAGITEPEHLDQRALDRFNGDLLTRPSSTGRPLAKASVASYLRGVRHFLHWTADAGLTGAKLRVRPVQVPRKVLDTLSRQDITDMESAADAERDKLIVRVLGDCGIRLGELLALRVADFHEDGRERYVKVTGKGSRERLVPLKPALYARLRRYAERGRPDDCDTDRIFISLRRRSSGMYEELDSRAVQQMLRALAGRAGIRKPVNPHSFRHSWVTNSLRSGVNPLLVARIAGHKDLSMIQTTYEHLNMADASRELMRALSDA